MDFSLSPEQQLLQETVRAFVARECPPRTVRTIFDGDRGAVPALWRGLAGIGVPGLVVPAAHGGAGLELLDLALVAEELGRGAVPVPYLGHALATLAIASGGTAKQQETWLPRLASGEARATVALAEEGGRWLPATWRAELADGRVRGRKELVPDADGAEVLVVGCRDGRLALVAKDAVAKDAVAKDAVAKDAVAKDAGRVVVTPEPTLDRGRPLATVVLENAPAEPLAGADAQRPPDAEEAQRLLDAGSVLLAADAFGAAHELVRATAAYLQTRRQFGQPVAQFQAVKHQLANMALDIDPTRGLWWYAAHAFDHAPSEASRTAALAKAHITDRAQQVARDAVEAHGGIGFTWECDVQIWFKRILFDRLWLGAPELHRERFAALEGW